MSENRARIFFGTELRRKREEAGLTGKELADALGCTPQWISTMESGRKVSKQSAEDLDTYFKTGDYFRRHWKLINEVELQTSLPRVLLSTPSVRRKRPRSVSSRPSS